MPCLQSLHFRTNEGVCGGIDLRRREKLLSRRYQLLSVTAEVLIDQSDVEDHTRLRGKAAPPRSRESIKLPEELRMLMVQVLGELACPIQVAQRRIETGLQRLGMSGKLID